MAAYALEWHPNEPIVASGGHDRQILLWNIEHYFNSHGKIPEEEKEFNLQLIIKPISTCLYSVIN